jgi:hypothetical protein
MTAYTKLGKAVWDGEGLTLTKEEVLELWFCGPFMERCQVEAEHLDLCSYCFTEPCECDGQGIRVGDKE